MEEIIDKYGEAIVSIGATVIILVLAVALFFNIGAFSGLRTTIMDLLASFFNRYF